MKMPSFSIVFFLLVAAFRASASLMVVEGDARLTLLLVTDKTLIAAKDVSGMHEEEVFALDTSDRTVKWRFNSKRVASSALMDGTNAFYMFTDNHLQKRDIRTGVLIWSTRLDSIPQQRTPPKVTLKDRWEDLLGTIGLASSVKPVTVKIRGLGGTPNWYRYKPVRSGSALALFRDATHSAGCVGTHCFSDWLTFDTRTGRQISGGSGDLLGDAGTMAIFEDQSSFWLMENGKVSEANFSQRTGSYGIPSLLRSVIDDRQHSWNGRCIFEQNANGTKETCLFDVRKPDLIVFSAPILSDFQVNWVLLDQHLLRYSECMAYSENEKRSGHPWFELYSFKGELIARTESRATNEHWYLSFLGTTKTGKVLFNNGDERMVVDTPSLKVMRLPASEEKNGPAKDGYSYTSSYMARGANCFYVTRGNITISKMVTEQRPHQLRISAVDAETNRTLWEHTERVLIKKIKNQ